MENNNNNYKLAPEHVAGLYSQAYLREAPQSDKFKSLDGALQRAVIEEALIETEAMKLSHTFGSDASGKEAFYFGKYAEFYSWQAAANPKLFREKDSRFLSAHVMKKDRDAARALAIIERARKIDFFKSGLNISRIKEAAARDK